MYYRIVAMFFPLLADGPCAVRYSRLKISDASISNPSPAEIVQRHNQLVHSIENYMFIKIN